MLVYGDHSEIAAPPEFLGRIAAQLSQVESLPGFERHARLVGVLVEAGRLEQGLADAGWFETHELSQFTHALARCVVRSWDTRFADAGALPRPSTIHSAGHVKLRFPEGFAFYAVYPEAYIEAARRLKLSAPPRVIGIRSIGTTLAAVVAASLGAPPAMTVRPFGDAFARRVKLSPAAIDQQAHYVIVDEGPGLSGSSFGAVADCLEQAGVAIDRIAFLPSHRGDIGREGSDANRVRWNRAQRVAAEFAPSFLGERFAELEEFSTGDPWERRKYVSSGGGQRVLLKFAGLGAIGQRKFEIARALHAAALIPEPIDLLHGFLVERWHGEALALASEDKPVNEIGHYIGARAELFPAPKASGASIQELLTMCRRNLSLACGEESTRGLARWSADSLSSGIARTITDNKLDREEWLRLPDGRLLKTDAVDHHCSHDIIGCQDFAWDVAGAIVEFALDENDAQKLIDVVQRAARRRIDPDLLEFYRVAYCCFRLGQARLAAEQSDDPAESDRLNSRAVRYETTVFPLLKEDYCCFTPQNSLID